MKARKQRLTVTVDAALVRAAKQAVATGRADSVSAWVNCALAAQADADRRLEKAAAAMAAYEAEHGEFTEAELTDIERRDRANAIVVRGGKVLGKRSRRRRAA